MVRPIVMPTWLNQDYANPIVIPVVMTIPVPLQADRAGLSRLRRAAVIPAEGWQDRPRVEPLVSVARARHYASLNDFVANYEGQTRLVTPKSVEEFK